MKMIKEGNKTYLVDWTLADKVEMAKRVTATYSLTHKGRNALEREIIRKGYGVIRIDGRLQVIGLSGKATSKYSNVWVC